MFRLFKEIQQRPENEKRRMAFGLSIFLTFLISIIWLVFNLWPNPIKDNAGKNPDQSFDSSGTTTNFIGGLFDLVGDSVSDITNGLKADFKEVKELINSAATSSAIGQ